MSFSRNIVILFILRAVRWFLVMMPVITIFYREHGLSNEDIFTIQACFAIAVVLFEIPTGYFSDVLGRKKSLIIGMIL
jgi:MFS family permease